MAPKLAGIACSATLPTADESGSSRLMRLNSASTIAEATSPTPYATAASATSSSTVVESLNPV